MKKASFVIKLGFVFLILADSSAFGDALTWATYYPAPAGRYKKMSVVDGLTLEKTATTPNITTGTLGDKYVWYANNSNNLSLAVKGDTGLLQVTPAGAVTAKGRISGGCIQMMYGTNTGTQTCTAPFSSKCPYNASKPEISNLPDSCSTTGTACPSATGFFTCCKTAALCN